MFLLYAWIWKLAYNNVDNILRLFGGWANIPFTTSKTNGDY